MSRKQYPEDYSMFKSIRNLIIEIATEFPEISSSIREELVLHPVTFDYLTRKGLKYQELNKYNQDLNKKKDEFYKKSKKKPPKNAEEEAEIAVYRKKLCDIVRERFLNKFKNIENEGFNRFIRDIKIFTNFNFQLSD